MSLPELERRVAAVDLELGEIRTAARRQAAVRTRRAFSQVAVRKLGHAGAEVARYVNRAAGQASWEPLAQGPFGAPTL